MIIRPKHVLLFFIDLLLAAYIYYVNYYLLPLLNKFPSPPVGRCLYLSLMTFIFFWLCWALYFELRDFWQFRWYKVATPQVDIQPVQIPILWNKTQTSLYGEILHWQGTLKNTPIIIFSHGFSDDCVYTRHITIPLALAGYDILTYDSRGTKRSRKAGRTNQFVEITRDLNDIIEFVKNDKNLGNRPIYLVGISLGALSSIKQGLIKESVEKIISIAAMSNYRENIPQSPITFKKNWWLWLRYTFFGVMMNPLDDINFEISPVLQLNRLHEKYQNEDDWIQFTSKKLFFIHAINDKIVSIENFYENRNSAKLTSKPKNWILTKLGGHNFLRYELPLMSAIIAMLQ